MTLDGQRPFRLLKTGFSNLSDKIRTVEVRLRR